MTRPIALILAAGGSRRLGQPKQLLPWKSTTLLNYVIDQVLVAGCEHCVVVVGANAIEVKSSLSTKYRSSVTPIDNENWQGGQSTSLRLGVQHVRDEFPKSPLLVALCDQPLIPTTHYRKVIDSITDALSVVATAYEYGGGVPACFAPQFTDELLHATKDNGAKDLIRQQSEEKVLLVDCREARTDIDTATEYAWCLNAANSVWSWDDLAHRG